MPRFEPFRGIRYDPSQVHLADVVAPPYDVIDDDEQRQLEERSPYNAVRVELARDGMHQDRYEAAHTAFEGWLSAGVLSCDEPAGFYVYRMGYRDSAGTARQTTGVLGALGLDDDVLPHERTMAKPKDDRLNLLRATRANLSPIWGLSLAAGLSALCDVAGPPVARCTDDDGVHHRLWRIVERGVIDAIRATVATAPVVIADGHHRYATAMAYRDERRREGALQAGDHDFVLAYVVELAEDELSVGPIHRVLRDLPLDFRPSGSLGHHFAPLALDASGPEIVVRAAEAQLPALVTADGSWLLQPQHGDGSDEPDAARLEAALTTWPAHTVSYRHSADSVVAEVDKGEAQVGLLLRPPTVAQIANTARAGQRMPEKTTFFCPKPLTGLVFRQLEH